MSAFKAQVIANKWSTAPREAYVRMLGALKAVETNVDKRNMVILQMKSGINVGVTLIQPLYLISFCGRIC